MKRSALLIGLLSMLGSLQAQQADSLFCRWLHTQPDKQLLDSLSVLPESIRIEGVPSSAYAYELSTGQLHWKAEGLPDSLLICYQRLPYALHSPYYRHSLAEYDSTARFRDKRSRPQPKPVSTQSLFADDQVVATGSLSRGLSFGNTQSVFVQSALNLQLEGKITEEIGIRGLITDQQVPYQPEGNTQNLQEFDKVLIELFTEEHLLQAGDLQLRHNPDGHFMRYTKSVQGGNYQGRFAAVGGMASSQLSLALSKGKFSSVKIEPQEGVSGPYRLPLPGGQGFTIVLANSEQVYLDGQLLQRGFQADYVIDYNLGELTFSPAILITRNSRIRVDYEYADQAYSRSLLSLRQEQEWKNLRVYSQLYRERDNANRPLQIELSEEDKRRLGQAGTAADGLYLPAIDSIAYAENRLLYARRDTLTADGEFVYYVYSTDPDEAHFQLSFAELGANRGNYVPAEYTGQGQVYAWVAPIDGVPQGTHEPVRQVAAPLQRLLWSNGLNWKMSPYSTLQTELSLSGLNQNLYAPDAAAQGMAAWGRYSRQPKAFREKGSWKWMAEAEAEYLNADFTGIDRFRSIEFERDWGLAYPALRAQPELSGQRDYWMMAGLGLQRQERQQFHYSATYREKPGQVNGWQHRARALSYLANVRLSGDMFLMQNQPEGSLTESKWQRVQSGLRWELPQFWPGYTYRLERNRTSRQADAYLLSSLQDFQQHEAYVQSPDSTRFSYRAAYAYQTEYLPQAGEAREAIHAQTWQLSLSTPQDSWQQLQLQLQHRENKVMLDSLRSAVPPQVSTGQLRWQARALWNTLRTDWLYTTGSSRELQRDFVYVEVAAGEGTHTWRDDNENGIQELNEFYEALNPDERTYIRLFVPSQDYLTAFSNTLNGRLNFEPGIRWKEEAGSWAWLSRFALRLNMRLEQKTSVSSVGRYLPWYDPEPEQLLGKRERWQADMQYNPLNPVVGFDLGYSRQLRRQQLSVGAEVSEQAQYFWRGRLRLKQQWNLQLRLEESFQRNASAYLNENQFHITGQRVRAELSYVPGPFGQLMLFAQGQLKEEQAEEGKMPDARLLEGGLEGRLSRSGRTQLNAQLRTLYIAYEGRLNRPAAYNMLEGFRPGQNWNWNLSLQHRILEGLQLSLTYDGRKPNGQSTIHMGRMAVSALF